MLRSMRRSECGSLGWRWFGFAWILLVVGGCAEEVFDGDFDPPPEVGEELGACALDADCVEGEVCRVGLCRTACVSTEDCPSTRPVCQPDSGYCVGCVDDGDCDEHEACAEERCWFWCRSDAACAETAYCDLAEGLCAERGCQTNADCAGGFRCGREGCEPIEPIVCEGGASVCSLAGDAVEVCRADGTGFTEELCGADARCVRGAAGAACRRVLCDPFALGCSDDRTAYVCDETGTALSLFPCGEDTYCAEGVCLAQQCAPSTRSCAGDEVLVCDTAGRIVEVERCALCSEGTWGCACQDGLCVARVCQPGSSRCVADGVQRCAADGLRFEAIVRCGDGDRCEGGLCLPQRCQPGERRCSGDLLVRCASDGQTYLTEDCGRSDLFCGEDAGGEVGCQARSCVPESTRCSADRQTRLVCNLQGSGETAERCTADTLCVNGVCRATLCEAGGAPFCDGGRVVRCDGTGTSLVELEACAPGVSLCVAGACVPVVCAASTSRCEAGTQVVCSADGLRETRRACGEEQRVCEVSGSPGVARCGACLEGLEESDGACVPRVAAPTGVTATQGVYEDRVEVTWQPVPGATGYLVYRDGGQLTPTPVLEARLLDTTAPAGGVPSPPVGVVASTDRIASVDVRWSASTSAAGGAVSYRVVALQGDRRSEASSSVTGWRSERAVLGYEVEVGGVWLPVGLVLHYEDPTAAAGRLTLATPSASRNDLDGVRLVGVAASPVPGAPSAYRVRARNMSGAGPASGVVEGRRVVGAVSYQWEWSESEEGEYTILPGAVSLTHVDTALPQATERWYRLVASASGASPQRSAAVLGRRPDPLDIFLGAPCTLDEECPFDAWCPTDTSERRCSPRPVVGGVELPFQWVPRGTFTMGSPEDELGREATREAQVEVSLTRDYFVQRTPVTQGQWQAVMTAWNALSAAQRTMSGWSEATPLFGTNPSYFGTAGVGSCAAPTCPVERVNWWDAVVYANALSQLEGLTPCYTLSDCNAETGVVGVGGGCSGTSSSCFGTENFSCASVIFAGKSCTGYRLLSEAEWERAVRAGTSTATFGGNLNGTSGCVTLSGTEGFAAGTPLADLAWYSCNSGNLTQAVGSRVPNMWGLHDMLGNVWEWTWTWYANAQSGGIDPLGPEQGSARVLRGGTWVSGASNVRSAKRASDLGHRRNNAYGFRLARSAP